MRLLHALHRFTIFTKTDLHPGSIGLREVVALDRALAMDTVAVIQEDTMQQGTGIVVEPNRAMTGINVATSNTFSKQNTGLVGELKHLLLLWRQRSSKTGGIRFAFTALGLH